MEAVQLTSDITDQAVSPKPAGEFYSLARRPVRDKLDTAPALFNDLADTRKP